MKQFIILFISVLIIFSLLYSCEEDEFSKDKIPPVISKVKIGTKDTIIVVNPDGTREVLYINTNPNPEIDTLILNKRVFFTGRFADETPKNLSSYRIVIAYDSSNWVQPEVRDTSVYMIKGFGSIFGKTDTMVVNQQDMILPDDSLRSTSLNRYLKVREGRYRFIVSCGDISGNEVTETFYTTILSRNTIIKNRNK
jgi:hypothetical protein